MWLASPAANVNSDNANFGPGVADNGNVGPGNNNMFNSNGNWNANRFAVRPVASINCVYAIICCIIDNIETNHSPLTQHLCVIN